MTSVLIVDGDEQIRLILARLLPRHEFDCQVAANAHDALAAMATRSSDVLLLEVELGGRSGPGIHRALRASGSVTPAVVHMMRTRNALPALLDELGPADDWIVKPWDTEELVARLRLASRRANGWAART